MIRIELLAGAAILAACAFSILGMYAALLLRSFSGRKRERLSQTLQPRMREVLVDHLAGSDDRAQIRQFTKESRRDLGEAVMAFQGAVAGGARDRLCELSLEQALVHDWCQHAHSRNPIERRVAYERLAFVSSNEACRRVAGDMLRNALNDEDSEVRFSAALAVLQAGSASDVERVFYVALSHNLLVRALLTEELRRHAALLCQKTIPEILASEDSEAIQTTLEILLAWERALPLKDLSGILHHHDREIRLLALRLTPFVPLNAENQGSILDSLANPDPAIAIAACNSAGRLRIETGMPGLARCLRSGSTELARAAARALAAMSPRGWTTLLELSTSSDAVATAAALEAMDQRPGG